MPVILGYESAIEFWRAGYECGNAHYLGNARTRRRDTHEANRYMASCTPASPDLQDLVERYGHPLHAITSSAMRGARQNVKYHTLTHSVHDCSFAKIDSSLYVSVPEFTFLQMASVLSLEKLILLGFEFCGSYSAPKDGSFKSNTPILTTPAKLMRFIETAHGHKGRRKAAQACSHILQNSASPKESQLAMLLCLPYRLGGYGLPKPVMNQHIEIEIEKQMILRKRFLVCDLYWPSAKVDLEYDSTEFHAAKERLVADARRRAVLESLGITSINITGPQIADALDFDDLSATVAKLLKKQLRTPPDFSERVQKLRREIGL